MRSIPLALSALILACSSNQGAPAQDAAAPDVVTNDAAPPNDASDASAAALTSVIALDGSAYELAEGLAVRDGKAYVGLAPTGTILQIDSSGKRTDYGHVPAGGSDGYTLGLVFDAQGDLFVLETLNVPDAGAPVPGVYELPPGGGTSMAPFATDANFGFPNGGAFDAHGNLLVADSATGRVLSVTPAGVVSTWKADDTLAGSTACNAPLPFPIGANGIVLTPSAAYVTNTSKGSIVKIDVDGNGDAGAATTIVADCQYAGFDGIALDSDGTLLAAINGSPGKLARVTTSGAVTVLASSAPLDGPASVAFVDGWNGGRYALVTNSAFFDTSSPKPGLLAYGPLP